MERNQIYQKWKHYRANIDAPSEFSSKVMEEIHNYEKQKSSGLIIAILSQIYFLPNHATRLAFALALSLLGLYRLFHVTVNILIP